MPTRAPSSRLPAILAFVLCPLLAGACAARGEGPDAAASSPAPRERELSALVAGVSPAERVWLRPYLCTHRDGRLGLRLRGESMDGSRATFAVQLAGEGFERPVAFDGADLEMTPESPWDQTIELGALTGASAELRLRVSVRDVEVAQRLQITRTGRGGYHVSQRPHP